MGDRGCVPGVARARCPVFIALANRSIAADSDTAQLGSPRTELLQPSSHRFPHPPSTLYPTSPPSHRNPPPPFQGSPSKPCFTRFCPLLSFFSSFCSTSHCSSVLASSARSPFSHGILLRESLFVVCSARSSSVRSRFSLLPASVGRRAALYTSVGRRARRPGRGRISLSSGILVMGASRVAARVDIDIDWEFLAGARRLRCCLGPGDVFDLVDRSDSDPLYGGLLILNVPVSWLVRGSPGSHR